MMMNEHFKLKRTTHGGGSQVNAPRHPDTYIKKADVKPNLNFYVSLPT